MKFAQVGYGRDGRGAGKEGKGYTYIVGDNVRTGDTLTPVVKHAGVKQTMFVTTGKVLTNKDLEGTGLRGLSNTQQEEIVTAEGKKLTEDDLRKAYTGRELGVQRTIGDQASQHKEIGGEDTYVPSLYQAQARAKSLAVATAEENLAPESISKGAATQRALGVLESPPQTFDEYSKQFFGGD